jgi:hypothetical protein
MRWAGSVPGMVTRGSWMAAGALGVAASASAFVRVAYDTRGWGVQSYRGRVIVSWWDATDPSLRSMPLGWYVNVHSPGLNWVPSSDMAGPPSRVGARGHCHIGVPIWMGIATVWMPAGLKWAVGRRRHLAGACVRCGYDLHGAPVDAAGVVKCPECGLACSIELMAQDVSGDRAGR